jgi:hypothetical protein
MDSSFRHPLMGHARRLLWSPILDLMNAHGRDPNTTPDGRKLILTMINLTYHYRMLLDDA